QTTKPSSNTTSTGRAGFLRRLGAQDWRLVDYWIDRLGLTCLAGQPYGVLSGGESSGRPVLVQRDVECWGARIR
ncbi:MAG: hypothetical protein R6U98_30620, partial [Pirellulaceae bacterium]